MAKKRTSLDSLFESAQATAIKEDAQNSATENAPEVVSEVGGMPKTKLPVKQSTARQSVAVSVKSKNETVKQTVYLPPAVHEQLRQLAFEERKKMHDYLVEGLDRVFRNRGLKPYVELSDATK